MYDYIVVGAGSSGCAFAARLANLLPNIRIALIESGEDYLASPTEDFSIPERFPVTWDGPANKGYRTVPQTALNGRQISIFRAAAVGGCSVVNAMIWMRGFQEDWDEHMPAGFKAKDVEREFEWLEERLKPVTYEGNFLGERGIRAAESLGYKKKAKESLWESPGTSSTLRMALDEEGRRQDVYRTLGADDSRITLLRGIAERIIFEHSAKGTIYASGVMLRTKDGSSKEILVKDKGEVIVSCGAIDSPKLLQISGVGPKRLMNELDIPLVLDSPVGEGLKDHVMYVLGYETPTLPEKLSPNSINGVLYDESLDVQFLFCDGKTAPHHAALGLVEPCYEKIPATTVVGKLKDNVVLFGMTMLAFILRTMSASIPSVRTKIQTSFRVLVNLMKPSSVGSVMIRSRNPMDAPIIDTAFLSKEYDMDTMIKGVMKARELVKTSPLSEVVGKELTPPAQGRDDERENIQKASMPYHHSTGTCSSCLDDQLRVKGIDRLRVADASSLPFHPRVPTNASSMAVGARCASLIANSREEMDF